MSCPEGKYPVTQQFPRVKRKSGLHLNLWSEYVTQGADDYRRLSPSSTATVAVPCSYTLDQHLKCSISNYRTAKAPDSSPHVCECEATPQGVSWKHRREKMFLSRPEWSKWLEMNWQQQLEREKLQQMRSLTGDFCDFCPFSCNCKRKTRSSSSPNGANMLSDEFSSRAQGTAFTATKKPATLADIHYAKRNTTAHKSSDQTVDIISSSCSCLERNNDKIGSTACRRMCLVTSM